MEKEKYEEICNSIYYMYCIMGYDDNKVIKSLMKDYNLTRKEARFCVSQWFMVENSLRG